MKAVISVHDTSPCFEPELLTIKEKLVDFKKSWLITPLWGGQHEITPDFVSIFEDEERVLHGLTHEGKADIFSQMLFFNAGLSREFRGLNETETKDRVVKSLDMYERCAGEKPSGFIPPNWYHNSHSKEILHKMQFRFTEDWLRLINLDTKTTYTALPLSFDYGDNLLLSRLCLWHSRWTIRYHRPKFIRFAIHPQDVQHGFLDAVCERIYLMEEAGYEFCSYEEMLN